MLSNGFISTTQLVQNPEASQFVMKRFPRDLLEDSSSLASFRERFEALLPIHKPFLCKYTEMLETEREIILIRPYIEGRSILDLITAKEWNNKSFAYAVWKVLARSIGFLHSVGISASYIKPSNIFLAANESVVITDLYPFPAELTLRLHATNPYDIAFLAPEYFSKCYPPTQKSDIWGLGILLHFLLAASLPFESSNIFSMLQCISSSKLTLNFDIPQRTRKMIEQMCKVKPQDRVTIAYALDHDPKKAPEPPQPPKNMKNTGRLILSPTKFMKRLTKSNMHMPIKASASPPPRRASHAPFAHILPTRVSYDTGSLSPIRSGGFEREVQAPTELLP